jgi:Domain of unknown function (DUF4340)
MKAFFKKWWLGGLALLVVLAIIWQEWPRPPKPIYFAQKMRTVMPEVTDITLEKGTETVYLSKKNGVWTVRNLDAYPADDEVVHALLFNIATLKVVEAKTSNAALLEHLSLTDIANNQTSRITMYVADGTSVLDMLVGKSDFIGGTKHYYVRHYGDTQTWLVTGRLPDMYMPKAFVYNQIMHIDRKRVRQLNIVWPDGAIFALAKDTPTDTSLKVTKAPEGFIATKENLDKVLSMGEFLRLVDVKKNVDKPLINPITVVLSTFDGLEVSMQAMPDAGGFWIKISASYKGNSRSNNANDSTMLSSTAVLAEMAMMNKTAAKWHYFIPDTLLGMLRRP